MAVLLQLVLLHLCISLAPAHAHSSNATCTSQNECEMNTLIQVHHKADPKSDQLRVEHNESYNVGLILVCDDNFKHLYANQLKSMECYADRHGYEIVILSSFEYKECAVFKSLFFRKHCSVAKFLEKKPSNYTAAVLDADVVVAAPARGLDKWINHGADVQLYSRCLFHEIAAGNYMVRNTKFARNFLMHWANYSFQQPPGFSSADNGAIHLVVMEAVQVEGYKTCHDMYQNLTAPVQNLNPYWNFVHCTKEAMGPPRAWKLKDGTLTVWPRMEFFAMDGNFIQGWASDEVGPIMHHGVKDGTMVTTLYYKDLNRCEVNREKVIKTPEVLGNRILSLARAYPAFWPAGTDCKHCKETCVKTFSCGPLKDLEEPRPRQFQSPRSSLTSELTVLNTTESRSHSWAWSRWEKAKEFMKVVHAMGHSPRIHMKTHGV